MKHTNPKKLKEFLENEVFECVLLIDDARTKVVAHLLKEIDLIKSGTLLTSEEKKNLNINPRTKVTWEILNCFKDEHRAHVDAKYELAALEMRAMSLFGAWEFQNSIAQIPGVNKVQFCCFVTEETCDWCRENDAKTFPKNIDLAGMIKKNCTCKYCKGFFLSTEN